MGFPLFQNCIQLVSRLVGRRKMGQRLAWEDSLHVGIVKNIGPASNSAPYGQSIPGKGGDRRQEAPASHSDSTMRLFNISLLLVLTM